jgi:hypothetical protein
MYTCDPNALARAVIEERTREAHHRRLARECRRRERPFTAETATSEPRRHSRLWSLVHFRHAYG